MDSLITAAAQALATGDPLGALQRVALRDDAPALALRGIAMAQLGDFELARQLLKKAARAFGPKAAVARARCTVAEAEIAFASRDLNWPIKALDAARITLEYHGDHINAAHARYLEIRRQLLLGQLADAAQLLANIDAAPLPPALQTIHELIVAGIAMRQLHTQVAHAALLRAERNARASRIPALAAEVATASRLLNEPAARLLACDAEQLLRLDEIETLLASDVFVVDACRYRASQRSSIMSLASRPVLFALARLLAQAWPADVSRDELIEKTFRTKHADESHRARLRVEMGRLRIALQPLANVNATARGFALQPHAAREVVVLAPLIETKHAEVLAFLADGEAWSSSALALALNTSQRTVQRALDTLVDAGKVQSFGRGRTRRWVTPPLPGFTTLLLLSTPLPNH